MKYRCLTYRELDLMDADFREFLYQNGTNKYEWNILNDQSHVLATFLLEEYSDLTLEKVLDGVEYLNYFADNELLSYQFESQSYHVIRLKFQSNTSLDHSVQSLAELLQQENNQILKCSESVNPYQIPKAQMCFQLIEHGAKTADQTIYKQLSELRKMHQN